MRILVCAVAAVLFALNAARSAPNSSPEVTSVRATLPSSLDAMYPPVADRPVFLIQMLQLDEALAGVVVDTLEGDSVGARQNFEAFRARYEELRHRIPEWTEQYPAGSVDELGTALRRGDPSLVMSAVDEVGKACHHCHLQTMVPVQQRYRWGDFAAEKFRDPASGDPVDFQRFKRLLATSMAGISVNMRQGQPVNALRQFELFREGFRSLQDSCQRCHEDGGRIFVSGEVEGMLEEMGRALAEGLPANAEATAALVQRLGQESCSKCHLVHVPASLARAVPG